MDKIRQQVRRAHWRLTLQSFGWWMLWSLVISLSVATLAIGLRKIWTLGNIDADVWKLSWLAGGSAAGLIFASALTWWYRRNELEAAIELDRRFKLKERVSSSLMLSETERDSEFGQALLTDTVRRVERLEVPVEFRLQANRWALLPLATAIMAFGVAWLVPDAAVVSDKNQLTAATVSGKQQVKNSVKELQKKLTEREKQLRDKQPAEGDKLLKELERGIEQLAKRDDLDQKKAMIQLNDLAKKLESRRDQLGGQSEMKQQLNQLANLDTGPAEKLASALKKGDFSEASKELQKLAQQMQEGKFSEQEKQQLAQQMKKMEDQIKQLAQAREAIKQDLQAEMEKKRTAGDMAAAEKLQRQLDQLAKSDQAMSKMQKMAEQMGQSAQAMQKGDAQQAQAQLSELAKSLQQMDGEMKEMEALNDALAQLENAKQAMNCSSCQGAGCSLCQGAGEGLAGSSMQNGDGEGEGMSQSMAMSQMASQRAGQGMGQGKGLGDRPESETDTSFYESQVKGQPKGGKSIVTGTVAGPNLPGDVRLGVQEAMEAAQSDQADPLEGVHLPRHKRDVSREYFRLLREGVN